MQVMVTEQLLQIVRQRLDEFTEFTIYQSLAIHTLALEHFPDLIKEANRFRVRRRTPATFPLSEIVVKIVAACVGDDQRDKFGVTYDPIGSPNHPD
jgi:hypothetical protein